MAASSPQHSSTSSLRDPTNALFSTAPSRTKSVQFSPRDNSMSRSPTSRSIDDRQPAPTQAHGRNGPADEITPIVSNERSGGKRNYATTSEDSEGMTAGQASAGSPGPGPLAMKNSGQSTAEADRKESDGWWKDLMDKYGTMELENKGSVARDHLALGMPRRSPAGPSSSDFRSRTNFPRVAADIAGFRVDRDCYHSTV
ncbi:MAG: hypothetical protein Q9172_004027 [Xanthocarpia lactea]